MHWNHYHHHARCAGIGRGTFALPGTEPKYERSLPFAFDHISLDLRVDLHARSVEGTATLQVTRRSRSCHQLELDAVAFEIREIRLDCGQGFASVNHEYDGQRIVIEVPKRCARATVAIDYHAKPKRGLYFLAPDETVKDRPEQVWSQCQDEDARHWFPCHDKPHVKSTASFRIRVPRQYQVLCNGEPTRDRITKSTRTVEYEMRHPLPSYLFTLVVGQFVQLQDRPAQLASGREVPVHYWLPKGKEAEGRRAFGQTPRMIELFSRLTGVEYPYERYTQVVVSDFIFGGMENTTATTMYEHILLDATAAIDIESEDLVAHELAHHWFGDYITCRDWPHAWLNEGFATYFEFVEREDRLGTDEYLAAVETAQANYLSESSRRYSRAIVERQYEEPIDLFDRHLYEKGGLVLHLLRQELGDPCFWSGIQSYLTTHGGGHTTTEQLMNCLEEASGRSLERFFAEWVFRPGHPRLKVRASWAEQHVVVTFEQLQQQRFELTFEIEVVDSRGKRHRLRTLSSAKHTTLSLPLRQKPKHVEIDPQLRLVGSVNVEMPFDWTCHQLRHGRGARAKRQAARWLSKRKDFRAVAELCAALNSANESWLVRAACARALGQLRSKEAFESLRQSLGTDHPKVRAAVAEALGNDRSEASASSLLSLLKPRQSYLVRAAAARALGQTRQARVAEQLIKQLRIRSWADVIACAALDGLATIGDETHVDTIAEYLRYGHSLRVRRSAAFALAKLDDSRKTVQRVADLLHDPHPHVRADAVAALAALPARRVTSLLRDHLSQEEEPRVIRKLHETLRQLESDQDRRELQDRLQRLERDLDELRGRLTTLESTKAQHE